MQCSPLSAIFVCILVFACRVRAVDSRMETTDVVQAVLIHCPVCVNGRCMTAHAVVPADSPTMFYKKAHCTCDPGWTDILS